MLIGYRLLDYQQFGLKVPVNITIPFKISNILITGKSGSGKSLSGLWYIYNLLHKGESYVCIADYKGGTEYSKFEGSDSYASGESAIKMINDFYGLFTEVRNKKIRLNQHISLIVEEWYGILNYAETQSKKLKAELLSKIGEILAVARGLNMGIILATQRADASLFSSGAREQFQCILCFGRCSAEQYRMLGFSGELENNPTGKYKSGQALCLIDNQDGVQEIIVPLIKNQDILYKEIRRYLDKQPDIPLLIQMITAGEHLV